MTVLPSTRPVELNAAGASARKVTCPMRSRAAQRGLAVRCRTAGQRSASTTKKIARPSAGCTVGGLAIVTRVPPARTMPMSVSQLRRARGLPGSLAGAEKSTAHAHVSGHAQALECCPTPGPPARLGGLRAASVNDCAPERMAVRSAGASAYSWLCLPADAAEQPSAYGIPGACDRELRQGARRPGHPRAVRASAFGNG